MIKTIKNKKYKSYRREKDKNTDDCVFSAKINCFFEFLKRI